MKTKDFPSVVAARKIVEKQAERYSTYRANCINR